jgi:hypothetical protein
MVGALGGRRLKASNPLAALLAVLVGSAFPIDVHAVTTTIHAAFDGRQPEMPARLRRDGSATTCEMEAFPGVFPTGSFWQSFAFCNGGPETCFTATFDEGTCGDDVHIMAYLDPFNPNDLPMNYLGDVGASDSQPFSFVVPAGARFLIVAQTNFGAADCSFGFTVDAMRCPAPAPLLSGFAVALAAGVLGLVAFAAMRRSRQGIAVLALSALIVAAAFPAAAPIAAEPTPSAARSCALDCSAAYKSCATERCDSGAMDQDPECITECHRGYLACVQTCPQP